MNKIVRIILLISALLAINIILLVGLVNYLDHQATAPLFKPPEHGTEFLIEADFSQSSGDTNMLALEKALQKRLASMGTHAFMKPISASQLRMMLPATDSNTVEEVRDNIIRRGSLELRLVNGLAGDFIESARVIEDSLGAPQISFTMKPDAAKRFAELTTQYSPDQRTGQRHSVAIVLDGVLYSAPYIADPIVDGNCEIDGNFTDEEAGHLVQLLNDPLPAPIKIVSTDSF